ncbi:MAG: hypothetical protein EOR25_15655 [Mesorhizobium sp.]|uniref:hypothetical protein n=1 Tax=Mesorhizobium sp. TaxID=1871066 RepID=UPI000FE32BB5|nr:hypothetical protein [Mesorhizobium sp.]RWI47585.1 MAG: hypothetical protein EOR15_13985 [Mesorhizobium sp.]RWI88219.1 MAG: hypothetical protein EOR20_04040 [Mesorhizobium sp.]RWJ09641.1 MAG: hypothetical protein EOR24_18315 [Mesorhizobium sp.]RWJ16326.1 MAG: hypothetical protein EOR25_15655 [Mesorhizobium sp.]RWJ56820.1 MAG: hypothetical protein EOR32_33270 [Mesorhizobium sp.]
MKIDLFYVEGEHDNVPGIARAIVATEDDAKKEAEELLKAGAHVYRQNMSIEIPLVRYERMEEFVKQMARMTTPEEEFEAEGGEFDGVTYDDVDEYVADISDERLCSEYSTFMEMVRQAKELVK